MEIRRAERTDAPALADLVRSLEFFGELRQEPVETTRARVAVLLDQALADSSHSVYVALDEGQLLGYASVHWLPYLFLKGPEGYVSELFLAEAARGRGIGTQLLQVIEQEARALGCSRLRLVNNRNRESYRRRFYEKLGWEEIERLAVLSYELGTNQ